jgi:hypothetical protein
MIDNNFETYKLMRTILFNGQYAGGRNDDLCRLHLLRPIVAALANIGV